ncbi:MAG: tetratricopeptide repeat protein, partial [Chloroflexota bacterium]|nr:tetratricopeptide repeat protein [Chloroflexota bacterium]
MDGEATSAIGAINLGAAAYHEGRLDDARAMFARALLADPESELGWLWFATVVEDPHEQRYCLNRALAINPESPGMRRLVLLPRGPAVIPPALIQLDTPALPPDLAAASIPLPLLPRPAIERQHRVRGRRQVPPPPATETSGDPAER